MERLHLIERGRVDLSDALIGRRHIKDVTFRPGLKLPRERDACEHLRLALHLLDLREVFLLELLELGRVEARRAQLLRHEIEHRDEVVFHSLDSHRCGVGARAETDLCLELVQRVLYLLPRQCGGAALEHAAGQLADRALPIERGLRAVAQNDLRDDAVAARLLGKERDLHAIGERAVFRAVVDVARRRVERFARLHHRAAFIIGNHAHDVRRLRHFRAIGIRRRDELGDRAVGGLEIRGRDALDVVRRDFPDAVAVQEHQSPIAGRGPLRERDADLLGVVELEIEVLERVGLHALDFLGREGA